MIEESWLQPCIDEALSRRQEHATFVDVGSNRGDWSLALLEHFDVVRAYDPDRRHSSPHDDVEFFPFAVAAESGEVTFHQRDGLAQSSVAPDHPLGHGVVEEAYAVRAVPLSEAVGRGWVDFAKVDIEGGEADLDYPDNVTCYLIECHGTFDAVLDRIPPAYAVYRKDHPLGCEGHCWLFAVREVPNGVGNA